MADGRRIRLTTAAALAVTTLAAVDRLAAQPAEPPAAILVFDGSGSMWGRLDGDRQAKFATARDGVKAGLAKLDPTTRLGLVSFGHRRSGDCTDVQVITPPEPAAAATDKIAVALEKLNPRGKGPLTAALREAANALPKGAARKTLILVHDDPDNCVPDACAALPDLQKAAPGVVVHVVGIAPKPDAAGRYQCLTQPTGGSYVDAMTAADLTAGLEAVLRAVSDAAPPAPPPASTAVPKTAPAPQPAKATAPADVPRAGTTAPARAALAATGPPALRLASVVAAGQSPLPRLGPWSVRWTVRRVGDSADASAVFVGEGQDVLVPLPAGNYLVSGQDGLVTLPAVPVTVKAQGQTGHEAVLPGGLLRSAETAGDAATALVEVSAEGVAGRVAAWLTPAELAAGVALPAGKWLLRTGFGRASREVPVEVKAGAIASTGPVSAQGEVAVTVSGASGATPVVVIAYEDDPEAPRGRREVARSAATAPVLAVAPGTYTIVARQGAVEARERIVVQAGERARRALALAGGRLALTSRLAAGGTAGAQPATAASVPEEPVSFRIERLDVVPPETFTVNRQGGEIDVPVGRYRVEARHGLVNARAQREVTVVAGQAQAVAVEQQAGAVRFTGPPGSAGDLAWEILDETGHPLWSTVQPAPRATLQAGRYIVRLDVRDRRLERRFEIRPGEARILDVRE